MEYDYRCGTQNHGFDNENQMAAYLAVAACNQADLKDFWIASNVDGVGKWDDIILYTETQSGYKKLQFLQLKHKENFDKCISVNSEEFKKDFEEFAADYSKILTVLYGNSNKNRNRRRRNKKIQNKFRIYEILKATNVPVSSIEFILMVNVKVKEKAFQKSAAKIPKKQDEYTLVPASQISFIMTNPQGPIYKISSNMFKNDTNKINFTEQFFILSEQSGVKNNVLLKDIETQLMCYITHANFKHHLKVAEYLTKSLKEWFPSESKTLSASGVNEIISCGILSSLKHINPMNNKCPTLSVKNWNIFQKLIDPFLLVVFSDKDLIFKEFFDNCSSHYFITCEVSDIDFIINCLKKSKCVKVILLAPIESLRSTVSETEISILDSLNKLQQECIELLNDCSVIIQGKEIKFGKLLNRRPSMKDNFTVDDILKLLSRKLSFGKKLEMTKNYVSRWVPRIFVKKTIFEIERSFFIVIAENNLSDVNSKLNLCFTHSKNSNKMNFKTVSCDTANEELLIAKSKFENVHVLKYQQHEEDFSLEWQFYWGETLHISQLKNHIENERSNLEAVQYEEAVLCLNYIRKVIIIANPGMGKTCLIKYLAKIYPVDSWVVLVTLNDINFEKVDSFQSCVDTCKKKLNLKDKQMFELYLANKSIVVLFDGFDEVAPYNEERAMNLIKEASQQDLKIVVTSREVKKKFLEENLNVLSFNLAPFTKADKLRFLETIFLENVMDSTVLNVNSVKEKTKEFTLKLLENCSLNNWDEEFTGIPLQCRLLGEGFIEHCKKYSRNNDANEIPSDLNLIKLYENFVEKKFDIYIEEKEKIKAPGCLQTKFIESTKQEFFQKHLEAAVQTIFPQTDIKISEEFMEDIKSAKEKCGIITDIDEYGRPIFVHRTFAEYFSAKWLVEIKENKNRMDESKRKEYLEFLLKLEYNVVRDLFDRILCRGCDLHMGVINREMKDVQRILEENEGQDERKCGRSALHIIAARGAKHEKIPEGIHRIGKEEYLEILDILIEQGIWDDAEDEVLRWTPQQYANHRYAFGVIEKLLQCKTMTLYNFENVFMKQWGKFDLLKMCAEYDYTSIAVNAVNLRMLKLTDTKILLKICAENDSVRFAEKLIHYKELSSDDMTEMMFEYGYCIAECHIEERFTYYLSGSLLHVAALKGCVNILVDLLKFLDVNIRGYNGKTALHWGCCKNFLPTVKALVKRGGNLFLTDDEDLTPMDEAVYKCDNFNERKKLIEYITSYDVLKIGFGTNIDSTLPGKFGRTALHYAALNNNLSTVERLISEGANVNVTNSRGQTALHDSCNWIHFDTTYMMQRLVESGLNINAQDHKGRTALHSAAMLEFNRVKLLKSLLELGANPDIRDNEQRTALNFARQRANDDIFCILWEKTQERSERDILFKSMLTEGENIEVRRRTFVDYPNELSALVDTMIEAGLSYEGSYDYVRCFSCECCLTGWEPSHDPWVRHALENRNCQFLIQSKGLEFINSCLEEN